MNAICVRWAVTFGLALTLSVLAICSPAEAAGQAASAPPKLGRGINILGYDGIWEGGRNAPFRLDNLTAIRRAGFSHVRINFFGFKFMDPENALDEIVLRRLDAVIEEVLARNLIPILDEHDTHICQRDVSECAGKLKAFWTQIAARYAGKYPRLVFEVLNEPGGQMTSAAWNALLNECLGIIRATNPRRPVIAAVLNVDEMPVEDLVLPPDDRNIIVTFHYYAPIRFTHQGAPWSPTFSQIGPLDWGTPEDEQKARADFDKIRSWSEREKRPIYLGEFGVYEAAPAEARTRYLSFVARSAERLGWAWAYWQFDHDFAAFDSARQSWKPEILRALIPAER
ncbi:glycoside hydrolase family 5 protein [Bradyrhizobium sp. NBAIM20]|uniref:glycoside hydrolase family 5 protein n=1 Tax=unclassified Bradyrhizobium TaxID=2631580 RepID=UPI001CD7ACD2|nr:MULTISPECIES: cellulase family glycosylhydrolase [unclassified Bradyrhizobium]MCA1413669.1 glycoside hydrolase family 5 protein [Bradyrhizobium sp. NBAIM20]MCA1465225.1 glycoside hydrolase family 5 protein [Bradyrhizobium sp. NBAIM18]